MHQLASQRELAVSSVTTTRRFDTFRPALAVLAVVILLQIELVFDKSINWDEFFHFSEIHQALRGEPLQWLQTPYARLFVWVPLLPGDIIDHIRLIRLLILPFELLTALVIYDSTRRLAGRDAAMVCVLAYLTGGFVFLHGFALRADMIATALLMSALWILLWRPFRPTEIALSTVLALLGFVATIKSVFYAPAFVGALLIRRGDIRFERANITRIVGIASAVLGLAAVITFATGIYVDLMDLAASSWGRMFSFGFLPQKGYFLKELFMAPLLSGFIAAAPLVLWRQNAPLLRRLGLFCFLLPLLSISVYFNAYPYFYAFILAPAMIALAPVAAMAIRRYEPWPFLLVFLLSAIGFSIVEGRATLATQESVQAGIRQVFPRPVRYLDDNALLSDYPRAVEQYASGWALAGYRKEGEPIYDEAIHKAPTPFLIRVGYALEHIEPDASDPHTLLPKDAAALRDNYIQHWGGLYVAGKRISAGSGKHQIEILVPGPYTVEGQPLEIDGHRTEVGDVVQLDRGWHNVTPPYSGETLLRLGDHLLRPSWPWPDTPLFTDF